MEIMDALGTIKTAMEGQSTALRPHFETSRMDYLMSLSDMTDAECSELRELAIAMPPEHISASVSELSRHLQFIRATLPTQASDVESGRRRTAVYARILGSYSNDSLAYMTGRVCRELDWFPTPRQCLAILSDYVSPTTRKDKALSICANHTQGKFEAFQGRLRAGEVSQEEVDAIPERWKRIFECVGLLRVIDDRFVLRRAVRDVDPCVPCQGDSK